MTKRPREDSLSSPSRPEEYTSPPTTELASSGHTPKYASIDEIPEPAAIQCLLPPHATLEFSSYDEYESHYQQAHTNRCLECQKNFPSTHLLDLHIAENHDPIVASRRDTGEKSYRCFVEGCDKMCLEWKKRRRHLIDKHGFPKNYDFFVVNSGVDGKSSMLRPGIDADGHRKSSRERDGRGSSLTDSVIATEHSGSPASVQKGYANSVEQPPRNVAATLSSTKGVADGKQKEFEDLTQSMSSLNMVPRSIRFGQGRGRAGFAKK